MAVTKQKFVINYLGMILAINSLNNWKLFIYDTKVFNPSYLTEIRVRHPFASISVRSIRKQQAVLEYYEKKDEDSFGNSWPNKRSIKMERKSIRKNMGSAKKKKKRGEI